jgi:hypothetical protein
LPGYLLQRGSKDAFGGNNSQISPSSSIVMPVFQGFASGERKLGSTLTIHKPTIADERKKWRAGRNFMTFLPCVYTQDVLCEVEDAV